MGTYGLEGVMRAWELEKLTTEQAIGQILQLVAEIEKRLGELETRYKRLRKPRDKKEAQIVPEATAQIAIEAAQETAPAEKAEPVAKVEALEETEEVEIEAAEETQAVEKEENDQTINE